MRIALDARYLNAGAGGIGTYLENLVPRLLAADPGLELSLVTRRPGLAARFDPARCTDLVFDAEPRSLRTIALLARRINAARVDLFHGPNNILPSGLDLPSVVTIHDILNVQNPSFIDSRRSVQWTACLFWRVRIGHALRHADAVITVSQATKDAIHEWFPELPYDLVTVVHHAVDPFFEAPEAERDAELARQTLGTDQPFLLVVGNASPHKNHHRAVEAFTRAFHTPTGADPRMRLVLIRRFVRHDLRMAELLGRPEVRARTVVLGEVDRERLRALYRRAVALFFPSWAEGFGFPLLEAMACGCPVVTSDRGALAEVAGDAALLVSPFDTARMAEALRQVAGDQALRERLVAAGRRRLADFSWAAAAERTLETYRRVLATAS